jgi:predicted nucleic acid-binding protein
MFREDFEGRVLPFNAEAAEAYVDIFAARRAADLSTPPTDLMIAAVARAKGVERPPFRPDTRRVEIGFG